MLQRTIQLTEKRVPTRPVRVLIEDPATLGMSLATPVPGVDISVCSGPIGPRGTCPLVVEGACAIACDVVVNALCSEWTRPVCRAWEALGIPVVDASDCGIDDPAERLRHHVGLALQRVSQPYTRGVDD